MDKIASNPKFILIGVVVLIVLCLGVYLALGNKSVPAAQTVTTGDTVQVYYTGTLTNGTVFDSNVGKQTLQFTVGSGQVIQGFDQGVVGMKLNQTKTLTIPANQAYGPVNPSLIIQVPLSKFGNQSVKTGMTVTQSTQSGQQLQGVVTSVNATTATLNFNSPLAGQTLIFKVTVVGIQQPSTSTT